MKNLILLTLFSFSSHANEIYFQGPCSSTAFLAEKVPGEGLTVGDITVKTLENHSIDYIGSPSGINSILGTPVGDNAIEVVSDTEMRAYGWCFEVDGFQPASMPDQIILKESETIRWFFAYSTYDAGDWKDYCTPSYQLRPKFLCP